jgi:hypothetical protein
MQPGRSQQRAPGSFSPLTGSVSSAAAAAAAASGNGARDPHDKPLPPPPRPQIRRIDSPNSDDYTPLIIPKTRSPQTPVTPVSPLFAGLTTHANGSSVSLGSQNFSRPARASLEGGPGARTASPLTLPPIRSGGGSHQRKHSQTQGLFEPTLPSTSTSNLSQLGMAQPGHSSLSASQIAAQAAMQHQQNQQHNRQRSQTVPFPGGEGVEPTKRGGTLSPPMVSLTEASVPREGAFGGNSLAYHNGLLGGHTLAATTAANVVFPRTSPLPSPGLPLPTPEALSMPPPLIVPEKPIKAEKSKVKLFSRPRKIDIKGDAKEKPLPSPSKIGSALASLQRGNYSAASLVDMPSLYSQNNSSTATIRPIDATGEKEGKEKKHHFLSRQKHKLSSKDDYHLPLSSAASNSRPVDPNAPSSLYNFNLPPSPGPNSAGFGKSVSGLDLRHGARALREKRKEEKLGMAHDNESVYTVNSEWPGPGSAAGSLPQAPSALALFDPVENSKYGLNNMTLDDAWPYLKAKLLVIFEGEDLRLPVEDFNRIVTMHIQFCIQRRSSHIILEDLRELLSTGFASLDHTLRKTSEDRLIPQVAELWVFTFTTILPYMQAVFLPLDLEFEGVGPLLSPEQAREFWAGTIASTPTSVSNVELHHAPASPILDVRRLVLLAYRDAIILPRYDKLKQIFSRLSLDHLPANLASLAMASPPTLTEGVMSSSPHDVDMSGRPGTAMSLDPSLASYNSTSTTLLGENSSNPSRSRAISNVSFGSGSAGSESLFRPLSNSTRESGGTQREQNIEFGSKQVTDMVGRMLQCMSVLASVGASGTDSSSNVAGPSDLGSASPAVDEGSRIIDELGRLLKLNWLGRGRTGRNRRGMVGGRVKRDASGNRSGATSGLGIRIGGTSATLREGVGAAS